MYTVPITIHKSCSKCPFGGEGVWRCMFIPEPTWSDWANQEISGKGERSLKGGCSRHPDCPLKEIKSKTKAKPKAPELGPTELKPGNRWFYRYEGETETEALMAYGPVEFEEAGIDDYAEALRVAKEDGTNIVFQASKRKFRKATRF